MNRDLEVLVTGLHWRDIDRKHTLLITYMFHGVRYVCAQLEVSIQTNDVVSIFDSVNWTRIRTIAPYAGCM